MFELNLIKGKMVVLESRRRSLRYFRLGYLGLSVVFMVMVFRFVTFDGTISAVHKKNNVLKEEIDRNRDSLKVETLEKEWTGYLVRVKTVNEMMEKMSVWSLRLRELSARAPGSVCIETMSVDKDGKKLLLNVIATSGERQGLQMGEEFIRKLGESAVFGSNVRLESHERTIIKEKEMERFRISIALVKK